MCYTCTLSHGHDTVVHVHIQCVSTKPFRVFPIIISIRWLSTQSIYLEANLRHGRAISSISKNNMKVKTHSTACTILYIVHVHAWSYHALHSYAQIHVFLFCPQAIQAQRRSDSITHDCEIAMSAEISP